jgi:hypothetical protein
MHESPRLQWVPRHAWRDTKHQLDFEKLLNKSQNTSDARSDIPHANGLDCSPGGPGDFDLIMVKTPIQQRRRRPAALTQANIAATAVTTLWMFRERQHTRRMRQTCDAL